MQYIKGLENYTESGKTAVTFGKFDGLHCGHQKLIRTVKHLSEQKDVYSVVCAFDMQSEKMLMTKEERGLHLENKVDYLVDCAFTKEFREQEAEVFIRDIIKGVFHADFVVVGTDFQFGYRKRGNIHVLADYAKQYEYKLIVIEKERYGNRIISSTYIKEMLQNGKVSDANKMLGYGYSVSGSVEHGEKPGRTLGFPTFSISWPGEKLVPPEGVYVCRAYMDGRGYNGIANIRVKPAVSIESFLFEFSGNVYGREVMIELLEYVRPEQKNFGIEE